MKCAVAAETELIEKIRRCRRENNVHPYENAIDLLLLDGAKALYPAILVQLKDRPRPGSFIVI